MTQALEGGVIPSEPGTESLAAQIMRRMAESGGFPALDHSVAAIVEAMERSVDDTTPLVEAVLADVSLTQKVLRLANSAMYAPIGSNVTTVSHAVHVLGFEAVGHLALGVKLIGSMGQIKPESHSAERELAHSLLAGSVAGSVVAKAGIKNGEMGVVCSLLHRMGRLLISFYLPEAWNRIQHAVSGGAEEAVAARAELGMSFQDVGIQVARQWRLPGKIVDTMQDNGTAGTPPGEEWLMALTRFSDRSAGVVASGVEGEGGPSMEALAAEFGPALGLPPEDMIQAVRAASDETTAEPALASILMEPREAKEEKSPAPAPQQPEEPPKVSGTPSSPVARLKLGVHQARQALDGGQPTLGIQRLVLQAAFNALSLSRTAVLVVDQGKAVYRVTATLAERAPNRLEGASIPTKAAADLAKVALAKKVDIYIDNPRDPKIAPHFPDWIRAHSLHPFFLLPITRADGGPMALFYGQQREDTKLSKEELAQLAALRDVLQASLRGEAGA